MSSTTTLDDTRVRTAAFAFLEEKTAFLGEVLPWAVLTEGFILEGQRVPLCWVQGIFKPAVLAEMPLSIRTAAPDGDKPRPYEDGMGSDGFLAYKYRGIDPQHPDNVGLRLAMQRQVPLVYLFGVAEGEYMPRWPVFVVGDDPASLTFKVAIDDPIAMPMSADTALPHLADPRRAYVTRVTLQRVHQRAFASQVLRAYQNRCSICSLRHKELLDAAHILPDGHPRGEPIVPNGIALCKLHHAAFDRHIIGINPNCVIEVRQDILDEVDGPMLRHGLQGVDKQSLHVPRAEASRPRRDLLEERYVMFRKAG